MNQCNFKTKIEKGTGFYLCIEEKGHAGNHTLKISPLWIQQKVNNV